MLEVRTEIFDLATDHVTDEPVSNLGKASPPPWPILLMII
jgi:hypothetical protein